MAADDDDALSLSTGSPLSSPGLDDEELPDAPVGTPVPVEPLATGRSRRSNAGNLLAKLLLEEADAEDTLFMEDEDDVEFTAKDINEPDDIPLESSSEDEDEGPPGEGEEDLEGERALLKAEREEKKAKKKKADEAYLKRRAPAIPKRVTIREDKLSSTGTDVTNSSAASPGTTGVDSDGYTALTRPRKKSERISWVPEFVATRASSRTLSLQNRETTMKKLEQSEKRRLHTIALMEAAAARKEKKTGPRREMTQEERLEEAKKTERRNLRSLTRWEEMERAKLEEQRKKLAALQNRRLTGPVITYWSGKAEWAGDGKLIRLGKRLVEELEIEGPKKKKPRTKLKEEEKPKQEKLKEEEKPKGEDKAKGEEKAKDGEKPKDDEKESEEKGRENEREKTTSDTPLESAPANPPDGAPSVEPIPASEERATATPTEADVTSTVPIENPQPAPDATSSENPLPAVDTADASTLGPPTATNDTPQLKPEPPQDSAPLPPELPPSYSVRNIVVLDNFESELRDKVQVMRTLCGNQIRRPPVPTVKPICVITHQPAKFCDPATGMPYSSLYAYREIRRILHGDIRWSHLLGCYVGEKGVAAKGVPEGFI